jgi:3(or 17)beta-hydroxysteroid dehydrogenase
MARLSSKSGIITGAASGLGEATARRMVQQGARLVITDINADQGHRKAEELKALGGEVHFIRQDVVREDDWAMVMDEARSRLGPIDFLVNNAAIASPADNIEKQSLDDWQRVMKVNVEGVFLGVKRAIAAMKDRGGSIVNLSSILGIVGSPTTAAYTASKGAVRLLTKSAALHCAKAGYGIRVNSVHPGFIWTPMLEETLGRLGDPGAIRAEFEAKTPLGRCGEPDDIAWGIIYLVSDEAKFVTGTELVIDGGFLAQ